ncbi:hNH endonuclease [Escherichia coli]|uniref:hNH endonuclease n=1 Tax=Escherichia coli TaxID=562 RepID=UPI0017AF3928|nr:hNH endonuclease [Escherichia coli]EFM2410674.1 hNH endonuclease [Escherichia coli]EKY4438373.1 hNH endonuclease [Escherichia coli]ELL8692115.1 hNH endonuclease [Escherichia coli]MDF7501486.1 hNH endonuclease [Escherichia coli]MDF7515738.1 hNH endonuclease [Escherichia coli]
MKQMSLIEMDGFLKGKCIPRDLKVNETNAEYLVRKFGELESKLETALRECRSAGITIDNLEAKCAALAAENAGLKSGILQASENMEAHHDDHGLFSYDADGEQMDALLRLCDAQDSIASLENVKTPDTDAFLAEVRAHDLNAFIRHHSAELDAHIKNGGEQFDEKSVRIRDIIVSARLFREQIRKEAAQ